jgi:signal transduction histidine kinase
MRLRTKFAIVLLAIMVLLSGGVFTGLEFYKQQAVGEVRTNVDETAGLVAKQIESTIRDQRDFVGFIASQPRAREFDRSEAFLTSFLTSTDYYAAQVIDANGTVVDSRNRGLVRLPRGNVSDRTYFQRGLRTTYVSTAEPIDRSPFSSRNSSHVLLFSAPIFEGQEVQGVFAAAFFLNENTLFAPIPALETSDRRVTVTQGGETLHAGTGRFESAITSTATVGVTDWTVTITRDRAALDSRLQQLALFQGLGLGLVLLSVVGFGYWQYSVSLRQTSKLLTGFEAIEEGDYEHTVSLSGGTEWERISDGVNELSRTLGEREAALQRRGQRLEVLHRVLRHNVRNQISVVLNYASAIADMAEDPMLADAGDDIVAAGRSLKDLSEKARQVETALQSPSPDPEPIDVAPIAREVAAAHREAFPGVDIEVDAPGTAAALAIPSIRLAVENAVENACEHTDADEPEVRIGVDRVGDRVRITVADNGTGIPEQDRAVIEAGRETDLEHGSGLGLWIVYWVVDNSGGTLSFGGDATEGGLVRIDLDAADAETAAGDPGRGGDRDEANGHAGREAREQATEPARTD